jgi:malate dehydrogenase
MDVAILGASGDCGRAIAGQLVEARVLATTERLQLVGRRESASASVLRGFVSDLTDAYAEHVPYLDVALAPEEIVADLWVVSAGSSIPPDAGLQGMSRNDLAAVNAPIFRAYAEALAKYGQGTEVVIIVSNPVELGVACFAEVIGRERVIGIGAFSDTLRFRREIASALGMRRQRVSGFMLGEHGDGQVPVWSSVQVHGMDAVELEQAIARLRQGTTIEDFSTTCASERKAVTALLRAGEVAEAFARVDSLSPDLRVVLKPYVTHLSGSKTVLATANVTIDLLKMFLDGGEMLVAGQAMLAGDFHGLHGPLGVPAVVNSNGIRQIVEIPLNDAELTRLTAISHQVDAQVKGWLADNPRPTL